MDDVSFIFQGESTKSFVYMKALGVTVNCVVTYCYVDFVVMTTEVELYSYLYAKDCFFGSFQGVCKAHVWYISCFGQQR